MEIDKRARITFRDSLIVAAYWFVGGYSLTWFLPEPIPLQTATICLIIGSFLYLLGRLYELFDRPFPCSIGILMIALPFNMVFFGVVFWVMSLLGLVSSFRGRQ